MKEKCTVGKSGQWEIKKWDMKKRCWEGYEPTPGKKAYSEDSCQPVKKEEVAPKNSVNKKTYKEAFSKSLADDEVEIVEWDNGDIDIEFGNLVPDKYIDFITKSICEKADYEETFKAEVMDISGSPVDSSMMVGDLHAIKKHTDEILKNTKIDDVAPDWVKSKITDAAAHLSAVADFMASLKKSKDFQLKSEHKSDKGGLTEKGRKAYNKATGGHLKAPQPGGGPRKRSFCARNKGQIDMHNIDCKKDPDKRACKARRRWKC
jgi:hypothetical protein